MNSIIIATDFSPIALNATKYAAAMAKEINASLILFHAYQFPVVYAEVPVALADEEELRKKAESSLDLAKRNLEHISSGQIKIYTEAKCGDVIDELENYAAKINPLAVVMGTLGESAIERILFGSTTLAAIKRLKHPIIAIPPGATYKQMKNIGFACDCKNVVAGTPEKAINNFIEKFNANMHVLHINSDAKEVNANDSAEILMVQTMFEKYKPEFHFIEDENIETGINKFAEENNLDLIIAIPKKHKLLDALFHKSSTRNLVIQSHIPVMCVHEE